MLHYRALNYGNYGIFLIMGHAGFVSSTVLLRWLPKKQALNILSDIDSQAEPSGLWGLSGLGCRV